MTQSKVDVLIIGAGPAGLFLATQLSKLKVNTRIVDKQAHPVLRGHADGLQCRTGEVFTALGVQSRFAEESCECAEVAIWNPDEKTGGIVETDRVVDTIPGISRIRHVTLGQDRVEAILSDAMKRNNNLEVERLISPTSLKVDESALDDPSAYPVQVTLRRLPPPKEWANGDVKSGMYRSNLFATEDAANGANGHDTESDEVVNCKFVVGCDGARSWVRRALGLELKGDSANVYWGAFDAVIKSDLPTLRMKNAVHSKEAGSVLMVPREEGMMRVYTQMGELQPGERVNRADVTLEKMIEKTKLAMQPYKMDFVYVDWYTCYEIGQRICDTFSKYNDHVFIAGDACHTHSPKAGQGMNISMMDTFNLGWKLAMVLKGQAKHEILKTYQQERHMIADELIDFDYKWSRLFSGKAGSAEVAGVTAQDMSEAWGKSIKFTSGTGVEYRDNLFFQPNEETKGLASKVQVGSHLPNQQVVCVQDAHTTQFQGRILADGRFRILIFPGDVREPACLEALNKLGEQLGSAKGPARRYTPKDADIDTVIETLTVFATPHQHIQKIDLSLPSILVPERKPYGVRAYDTLYSDEPSHHDGDGRAYEGYGVDPKKGCVIITRPDQHVSGIYAMDDYEGINSYFASFMLPAL